MSANTDLGSRRTPATTATTTTTTTTARPAASGSERATRISAQTWADIAVIIVLGVIGMVGFGTAFDSVSYLVAGVGGLLVGAAAILLCHLLRFNLVLTLVTAMVLWFVLGSAIAIPGETLFGVVPSLRSLGDLSLGAVNGWSDLLTLRAPVSLPEYVNAVPYLSGTVVSLISIGLAVFWLPRHRRTAFRGLLVLLAPIALYLSSVLLGTDHPYFASVRGIGFAAIALVWMGWRRSDGATVAIRGSRALLARKMLGAGLIVLVAIVAGGVVGSTLAPTQASRFVLRDRVQPPFEPLTYASPLAGFRHYTKTAARSTLFTVEGLKSNDLLRLASLDTYNGEIWGVAGAQQASGASGSFQLVGRNVPTPAKTEGATPSTITVTVDKYSDVWMPTTGVADKIAFSGAASKDDLGNVRYNDATGTAVLTTGLTPGTTYTVTDTIAASPSDPSLAKAKIASFAPSLVTHTPDAVVAKAIELTAKAQTPIAKLRAIQQWLATTGYFSHGTSGDQVPSRAGHGADRMYDMVTLPTMVGDQEQYASLFALMARSLGYPVRVVIGFDPKVTSDSGAPVEVTGTEVTAWDEVAFEGVGWVPFYPTPKNPDVPQSVVPKPQTEPQPQVRQPPRTNSDQDDLVTPVQVSKTKDKKNTLFNLPAWAIWLISIVLVLAIILFVPLIIVSGIKRRRMRRRRRDRGDRAAAGAWDEMLDRFSELGYTVPQRLTRSRVADGLQQQVPSDGDSSGAATSSPQLRPIAVMTDVAVFSGDSIGQEQADRVWAEAIAAVEKARRGVSPARRLLSRYRLSTVRAWFARLAASAGAATSRRPANPSHSPTSPTSQK